MPLKRRIPTLALGLLGAFAVAAPAANADNTRAQLTCALGPGVVVTTWSGAETAQEDLLWGGAWDPLRLLDVDSGTFDFQGPATCAGADVVGPSGSSAFAPTQVTIRGTGTFDNLICGTGTANLTGSLIGGDYDLSVAAGLTFVAGAGKLTVTNLGGRIGPNYVARGEGTGYAQIVPTGRTGPPVNRELPAVACATATATSFEVLGGFAATVSGTHN